MKKFLVLGVVLAMVMAMFTACGSKFTCDLCEKEKSGKKHTAEIFGEKIEICDDCNKELNEGMDAMGDIFN